MFYIELLKADITQLQVDVIVNAANNTLLGGGGVDGAIHSAAGAGLFEECRNLNGCKTGEAKLTSGYNLLSKFVIHTVGPVWNGGGDNEDALLENCYKESLRIAEELKLKSIAIPNISTGAYGFPKQKAAEIAINAIWEFGESAKSIEKVILVSFDSENYSIYKEFLSEVMDKEIE